ncbi:hypothetical protein ebA1276 [Aromatoleum aromaticum EbN1]|uniref:Uncharacterized protein n=1 Tax=Aromatoleum aromaticum (strain DSM 19018 / LMG 30748 / EbN1) TaxID=76114 RepID=Q5P7A5_AROAE|nr:hypothetical protein ebA1276 [Aromatoleum aromaticum EbN1]
MAFLPEAGFSSDGGCGRGSSRCHSCRTRRLHGGRARTRDSPRFCPGGGGLGWCGACFGVVPDRCGNRRHLRRKIGEGQQQRVLAPQVRVARIFDPELHDRLGDRGRSGHDNARRVTVPDDAYPRVPYPGHAAFYGTWRQLQAFAGARRLPAGDRDLHAQRCSDRRQRHRLAKRDGGHARRWRERGDAQHNGKGDGQVRGSVHGRLVDAAVGKEALQFVSIGAAILNSLHVQGAGILQRGVQ